MSIAFVFSGQGAQYPGMGRSLYDHSPAARQVFDAASRLRPGTLRDCWDDDGDLNATLNTQPCMFCVSVAAARALEDRGVTPAMVAGFSVGEMAAVYIAGLLPFEEAFSLTNRRADAMRRASQFSEGGMLVVLGLDNTVIEGICQEHGVWPVNYNCPGQTVVSGARDKLDGAGAALKAAGGRVRALNVSGGFHSPLMAPAADELRSILAELPFAQPQLPIYSNVTAQPYGDPRELLEQQVKSPVLWQQTIEHMHAAGADIFVECGPGKVLSGLVAKTLPEVTVCRVEDADTLAQAIETIGGNR